MRDIAESADPRRLLAEYAERGSEPAFRAVTEAYLDLVYSTALRLAYGHTQLAEDIAQTVFIDLARHAGKLGREPRLGGWLHRHTCFVAAKVLRAERRRRERERRVVEMNTQPDHSCARLEEVAPVLDDAINRLGAADRAAILLRFYERLDFRAVGQAMETSEAAAQKRVTRALEKLRVLLGREGASFSAIGLGNALWRDAIIASPHGMAAGMASASVTQAAAVGGSSGLSSFGFAAGSKAKIAALAVALAASVVAPALLEFRAEANRRAQDDALSQQAAQIATLTAENGQLANLLANLKNANGDDRSLRAVLRWRNQVGQLRAETKKLGIAGKAFGSDGSGEDRLSALRAIYATQVERLRDWLAVHPSEEIPELKNLSDDTWLGAVSTLDQDDDFERAASNLRGNAELQILSRLSQALRSYAQNNNGQFPSQLAQLKPYLTEPVDDAVLQRYEVVPASSLPTDMQPGGDWAITQIAAANPAIDGRLIVGLTNTITADERVADRWKSNP